MTVDRYCFPRRYCAVALSLLLLLCVAPQSGAGALAVAGSLRTSASQTFTQPGVLNMGIVDSLYGGVVATVDNRSLVAPTTGLYLLTGSFLLDSAFSDNPFANVLAIQTGGTVSVGCQAKSTIETAQFMCVALLTAGANVSFVSPGVYAGVYAGSGIKVLSAHLSIAALGLFNAGTLWLDVFSFGDSVQPDNVTVGGTYVGELPFNASFAVGPTVVPALDNIRGLRVNTEATYLVSYSVMTPNGSQEFTNAWNVSARSNGAEVLPGGVAPGYLWQASSLFGWYAAVGANITLLFDGTVNTLPRFAPAFVSAQLTVAQLQPLTGGDNATIGSISYAAPSGIPPSMALNVSDGALMPFATAGRLHNVAWVNNGTGLSPAITAVYLVTFTLSADGFLLYPSAVDLEVDGVTLLSCGGLLCNTHIITTLQAGSVLAARVYAQGGGLSHWSAITSAMLSLAAVGTA